MSSALEGQHQPRRGIIRPIKRFFQPVMVQQPLPESGRLVESRNSKLMCTIASGMNVIGTMTQVTNLCLKALVVYIFFNFVSGVLSRFA